MSVVLLWSVSASFFLECCVLCRIFVVSHCLDRLFESLKCFHLRVLCTSDGFLVQQRSRAFAAAALAAVCCFFFSRASQRVLCSLCDELCRGKCSRRKLCNSTRAPTSLAASCDPNHHCPCPHTETMSIHRTKHRLTVSLSPLSNLPT